MDFSLRMDALSGLLCLVVTLIGTLIHVYSIGYMAHEKDYSRFFAYLNLFCAAMLLLVLGDSLPVVFIGWEGVGLASYLLIGSWYQDNANASAGKKAFITNRIGDFGFLLGMFLLFRTTGTLSIPDILDVATHGQVLTAPLWLGQSVAFWVGLLLFLAAAGKSAQIPLYVWLPDAMAGPTPVSALIHAATMVTAGVYLVARMQAVYLLAPAALAVVAIVGALTALLAALIGFAQNDFKKVLAYSTVSQLGFMFVGGGYRQFLRRHLPPLHPRLLQGRAILVCGLGHARHGRLRRHHQDGWAGQAPAGDYSGFPGVLAGYRGRANLLGFFQQGRHSGGYLRHPGFRAGPGLGRAASRGHLAGGRLGHGLLHV